MAIQSAFTLTANEIYESLANMIISQEVFADNIGKNQTLVDKARVDGGLYGDTKLFYATDVLESHDWLNDEEAGNLLSLDRPKDPQVQAIKLDQFRQIRLTLDNYMTKRAFADEGTFASFNGIMLGWMRDTKKVYDGTTYNCFIGTTVSPKEKQNVEIDLSGASSNEDEAKLIAQGIADLLVEMGDYSRDFNDYENLRSYAEESIEVIWNSKWVNKIRKVDLPAIFHKDGLVDKFEEDVLPGRYFGTPNAAKILAANNDGSIRSVAEADFTGADSKVVHCFPGDFIPAGIDIEAGVGYVEDADVICKVVVKLPPYMSSFSVGTTFFNARSLTENHYLTYGINTLAYLKNYPFITVKAKKA